MAAPVGAGRARRRGSRASHPPGRSFLPMTTWHLMHFFILRAHSAGGGERGWAGPRGLGHTPPPHTHTHPHSPSHTVRCWHGENSTSSASSEHTRHSAASGPDGAATCRFVTVLGVPSTSLGPGAAPPLPPACRSLRLEEGLERAPGLPGPRPPPPPPGSPEALRAALQSLKHAALGSQVQRAPAAVVGVAHVGALQRQEARDRRAHRQLPTAREPRGL